MDTLQGMSTRTDNAPEPAIAPTVALPKAGEAFSDEELHRRFGAPTEHRIRVSRENKCTVLVHLAGIRTGYTNADLGADILYMGENSDREGLQDQEMSGGNLALRRSKEEGYAVLYFIKEGGVLVYRSLVEYDSCKVRHEVYGKDRLRKVVEFKLRSIHTAHHAPDADERGGLLPHPVAGRAEFEEMHSPPLTHEEAAAIEDSLSGPGQRSLSRGEFLDIVMDDENLEKHIRSSTQLIAAPEGQTGTPDVDAKRTVL